MTVLARRRVASIIIPLVLGFTVLGLLSASMNANQNGVGAKNQPWNCGNGAASCHEIEPATCGCHGKASSVAKIELTADKYSVAPYGEMAVKVSVRHTEQAAGKLIGVMLCTGMTGYVTDDVPQNQGWTIIDDESAGYDAFNYVEKAAKAEPDGNGTFAIFNWTLEAPGMGGQKHLYARAQYGPGNESQTDPMNYYLNEYLGITITVDGAVGESPSFALPVAAGALLVAACAYIARAAKR